MPCVTSRHLKTHVFFVIVWIVFPGSDVSYSLSNPVIRIPYLVLMFVSRAGKASLLRRLLRCTLVCGSQYILKQWRRCFLPHGLRKNAAYVLRENFVCTSTGHNDVDQHVLDAHGHFVVTGTAYHFEATLRNRRRVVNRAKPIRTIIALVGTE